MCRTCYSLVWRMKIPILSRILHLHRIELFDKGKNRYEISICSAAHSVHRLIHTHIRLHFVDLTRSNQNLYRFSSKSSFRSIASIIMNTKSGIEMLVGCYCYCFICNDCLVRCGGPPTMPFDNNNDVRKNKNQLVILALS